MEINYVCSLGQSCHSAQLLKRNNLKVNSYPFDWVFAYLNIVTHCLEDDFNTFLNKSRYCEIKDRRFEKQCGHIDYEPNFFNHKDPRTEDHYAYYQRCVYRFKNLLSKNEPKLFIMITNEDKNKIYDFNSKFSNFTSNYTLLVINFKSDCSTRNYEYFTNGNLHFIDLQVTSSSTGARFRNEEDNVYLDSILKSIYNFQIKSL